MTSGQGIFGVETMIVKLFLLGNPGSGKSTVARYIETRMRDQGWSVEHINDYGILYEMFEEDQQKGEGRFRPTDHGGFDVLNFKAFDEALQRLEERSEAVFRSTGSETEKKVVMIEFARNDYLNAFHQFSREFQHSLPDAYYLYLDTEIAVCKARIRGRVKSASTPDDYHVSKYIFEAYYCDNNGPDLAQIMATFGVKDEARVKIIDNNSDLPENVDEIADFLEHILQAGADPCDSDGVDAAGNGTGPLSRVSKAARPIAASLLM